MIDLKKEEDESSELDWVFGATSPECIALIPEEEREKYLPIGEVQVGLEDTMDCASRGPINILETKFNYLLDKDILPHKNWLLKNGYVTDGKFEFSDAFIGIKSETTKQGNSLKAPIEAIRKFGLVPKWLLPLEKTMNFEQYHNPERITEDINELGLEFLKRFSINYDKVYEYGSLQDMYDVAGFAWSETIDGVFQRTEKQPNHCFIVVRGNFIAFDNYVEFIKKLSPNYKFYKYGYRLFIGENEIKVVKQEQKICKEQLCSRLLSFVKRLLACYKKQRN